MSDDRPPLWIEDDLADQARKQQLPIWVVYDRPSDFPDCFVARLWMGEKPTDEMMMSADLGQMRRALECRGKVRVDRSPDDHPRIVETWL